MTELVQQWSDGSRSNNGFNIGPKEPWNISGDAWRSIASSEYQITDRRPKLEITYSTNSPGDDNYEPNNSRGDAYDLTSYERIWLHAINGYGIQADDDWYEIYVGNGFERLLVNCQFSDSEGDIDIEIYNASGSRILESDGTTDNEYIDEILPAPGTYYVLVTHGDNENQYDLFWDAAPPPDTTPPTPNPMTWTTEPFATSATSISMMADLASDPSDVEYYYECLTPGGHDSGWQSHRVYEDTDLQPDTEYTYRIKARDKSTNQNETSYSTAITVRTVRYIIDFIVPPVAAIRPGTQQEVTVSIKNAGPSARKFWIGLSFSGPNAEAWPGYGWFDIPPLQVPSETEPDLASGGTAKVTIPFVLPDWMPDGQYTAYVAIWKGFVDGPQGYPIDEPKYTVAGLMVGEGSENKPLDRYETATFNIVPSSMEDRYGLAGNDPGGLYSHIPSRYKSANLRELPANKSSTLRDVNENQLSSMTQNILVLFHGWKTRNAYQKDEFLTLKSNLLLPGKLPTNWRLVPYYWEEDSNTGFFLKRDRDATDKGIYPTQAKSETIKMVLSEDGKAAKVVVTIVTVVATVTYVAIEYGEQTIAANSTLAAFRAYMHGLVLGERLCSNVGIADLKKVHIVAHSAGSWGAYAALRYLSENAPNTEVQVTYLDPFIPKNITSSVQEMLDFVGLWNSASFFNSSVLDGTKDYAMVSTTNSFAVDCYWTLNDGTFWGAMLAENLQDAIGLFFPPIIGRIENAISPKLANATIVSWNWSDSSKLVYRTDPLSDPLSYDGHAGPIQFYADSVSNPSGEIFSGKGWQKSLAFNSSVSDGAVSVNVTPDTASWTISGPSGFVGNGQPYTGDKTFSGAPVGLYTWTGQALSEYNTPLPQTKPLASGGTASFIGTWIYNPPDTTSPTVSINSPSNGQTFTSASVTVSGSAADPGDPSSGVALVEVRVNDGSWQTALGTTSWNKDVTLASGANTIEARSKDNVDSYSPITSVNMTFNPPDMTSPTVSINSPSNSQTFTSASVTVSGSAADSGDPSSGVALVEVRVNDGSWQTVSGTTSWSKDVTLSSGANTIQARSKDNADNYSTIASVDVTYSSDSMHPADTNEDWRLSIDEITAYGAAWKRGDTWPVSPNPIPIDYVTNAGMLWKSGETYHYVSEETPPQCWQSGSSLKLFLETLVSGMGKNESK